MHLDIALVVELARARMQILLRCHQYAPIFFMVKARAHPSVLAVLQSCCLLRGIFSVEVKPFFTLHVKI